MLDKKLLAKIETSLDTMRPYLRKDGGDIEVVDLMEDGVLHVKLMGACIACPQSYMTMKAGIEQAVIKDVPEVKKVIAINLQQPAL